MTTAQTETFRQAMNIRPGHEWDLFEGLDVPEANTILIERADRLGLATLYQLRGRVGRREEEAYAYLFLHRHAALVGTAGRRLTAIRQYNQLGAGFRIALRDLASAGQIPGMVKASW